MTQARGYGQPRSYNAPLGTETYVFKTDGLVPNSSLPVIVRRSAVTPNSGDPAGSFVNLFQKHDWTGPWDQEIHEFTHYHSTAHEVIGVVAGTASIRFGGENNGDTVALSAGDVAVIPAGVAHALIKKSDDFAVTGAFADGRAADVVTDDPKALQSAKQRVDAVPLPANDPIDGGDGPLTKLWG
jgi:uncharacterized protein YjlB